MTECGRISTLKYQESDKTGSSGNAIGDCEIRMDLERASKFTYDKQYSELLIRSKQLMDRYRNALSETEEAIDAEGWLRSGDIGNVENGKVYLIDRPKDIIKVDAWSISPVDLEHALLQFPEVDDVAVVGTGYSTEEHPVVFVVTQREGLTASHFKQRISSLLASYKVSRCEIRMVESIPRGTSGKISRTILRKRLEVESEAGA